MVCVVVCLYVEEVVVEVCICVEWCDVYECFVCVVFGEYVLYVLWCCVFCELFGCEVGCYCEVF